MMQQHGTVQPRAETPLPDLAIVQIQQRVPARIQYVKPVHSCRVCEHVFENSEFLQDHHAGRLQQKTRAHRLALLRPLEQDHLMPLPFQQYRRRRPRGAATDDRDTERMRVHQSP